MKKSRTREEYWEKHIEAYRKSRLSQKGYCRQAGISYWSFNQWKRRIESRSNKPQEIPQYIVSSLSPAKEKIEIIIEGIRLSIPDGFSEETLGRILRMVGAAK